MKTRRLVLVLSLVLLSALTVTVALAAGKGDLAQVRRATAKFHRIDAAIAEGYVQIEGLDYCFENPGVGDMGFHYINPDLLDTTVNILEPEAMVYAPGPKGEEGLQLGAVEYIVPASAWDQTGNTDLPELFGRSFHLNEKLGVYVLHAWIFKNNPAGIFEDWNPQVACP